MKSQLLESNVLKEYLILSSENEMFQCFFKTKVKVKNKIVECVEITYSVKISDNEYINLKQIYEHRDIIINLIRNTIKTKKIKVNHYECYNNEPVFSY